MRIEKIYINNFGKLHDFTLDFSDGFNLVFGKNEDGKTTVMYFLRLMFYGGTTSKSDLNVNIRKRYTPFSGGIMGGTVEFSHSGKRYSLSKEFRASSRTDRTVLTDLSLGIPVSVPAGKEIGELFFLLGAGAFERSIFIGRLTPSEDNGVNEFSQKLAAAVYAGDGDSYEDIRARLCTSAQLLHTPRNVGITDKLRSRIAALESELLISQNAGTQRALTAKQLIDTETKISELLSEKEPLERTLNATRQYARKKLLENELSARKKRQTALDILGGITQEELEKANDMLRELDRVSAELDAAASSAESTFIPNDDITCDLENATCEYNKAAEKSAKVEAEAAEAERNAALHEAKLSQKRNSGSKIVFFILAAVIAAASVSLSFVFLPALAGLAVATVLLIVGLSSHKHIVDGEKQLGELKIRAATLLSYAADAKAEFKEKESLKNTLAAQKQLYEDSAENLHKQILRENERRKTLANRISDLKKQICILLRLKIFPENVRELLGRLSEAVAQVSVCDGILATSGLSELDDEMIERDLSAIPDAALSETEAEKAQNRADELSDELETCKNTATRLRTELQTGFSAYREVAVIENELRDEQLELESQDKHLDALLLAEEILDEAYAEMRSNFAPELNRLTAEIFGDLTDGKYDSVIISKDFDITVHERGAAMPYDCRYLSDGAKDQIYLALRLALSQLIAGENDLPLILDDSFIQYDDGRAETGMKFISRYSDKHQVLFFTCHGNTKDSAQKANARIVPMKTSNN